MLQERGIPFQSFYSVNMIRINARRDLLNEIAGRNEVLRIESNPHVKSSIPVPGNTLSTLQSMGVNSTVQTPGGN